MLASPLPFHTARRPGFLILPFSTPRGLRLPKTIRIGFFGQRYPSPTGSRVQELALRREILIFLYFKEGDQDNAAYWYGRAGKLVGREPLDAEWFSIVKELFGSRGKE